MTALERALRAASKGYTTGRAARIDPATCEILYDPDELEFLKAIDAYKRESRRPFPTWSEALRVLKSLGYAKTNAPTPEDLV